MRAPPTTVQMAYARIAGIGREAERQGVQLLPLDEADLALLAHERELQLLRSLSELEDVISRACLDRAPHRLAGWVREFADHFHGFYHGYSGKQSKAANALFAVEASRRWAADGVTANAAMPGYPLTNLQQNDSAKALAGMTRIRVPEPKTIEQGAATSVLLATAPLLDGTGGRR